MSNAGQRFRDVVVSGLAHLDAPHIVTSEAIEAELAPALRRMGLVPGLLGRVAGIKERRIWDVGMAPSAAAAEAGALALERSGVLRGDVGALINTSVSRDYLEPSTASITHGLLDLPPTAVNFDLGSACLGFLNGMNLVAAMIERGEIEHGLVVNAESSRFVMEATIARLREAGDPAMFREQFATLTLGSGAVGMVLSRAGTVTDGHPFLGGLSRARTEHALLCTGHADDMRTDLAGLLTAGLDLAKLTWKEAVDAYGWDAAGFDVYAVHQISTVHTRALCETLGLDENRFPLIFPRFGNIGPASVPTVLSKSVEDGRLRPGHRVVLMGVGSGLNAAAAELLW